MAPVTARKKKQLLLQNNIIFSLIILKRRRERQRQVWVREVFEDREVDGDYYNLIPKLRQAYNIRHDKLYIETFRVTPAQFDYLLSLVTPEFDIQETNMRKSISVEERLYITMRYLATGDKFRSLSLAYRVGKSTVCEIIPCMCEKLWKVLAPIYLPSYTPTRMEEIAISYEAQWNFPNCVGSIDGKHIKLRAPPNAGSLFYNYKGTHSIVLMAACDASYKFTYVDIGNYGRISDGGVFAASTLGHSIDNEIFFPKDKLVGNRTLPFVFVGDAAFPLKKNLMKPYSRTNLSNEEIIFNYRLSRARRCIENAFGILSSRFQILLDAMPLLPENAESVVKASVILHNFLLSRENVQTEKTYSPHGFGDYLDNSGIIHDGEWRKLPQGNSLVGIEYQGSNMYKREARDVRNEFKQYFLGPGSVPWQYSQCFN